MKRILAWLLQIPLALAAFGLLLAIDWLGLRPAAALTFFLIGGGIGAISYALTRRVAYAVPSIVFLSLLLLALVIDMSPVQPATRAVRRIKPGMSEAAVRSILREEFPPGGRFRPPGLERPLNNGWLSFTLDPNDDGYNGAIVAIQFVDGRVARAEFHPD
jgi:hypothetical protein